MTADRVSDIISKFSGCHVLVLGDVILDRYIAGSVERINPEAPVPILLAKDESFSTGGAGNTAKNAASLGADVVLVGVIGSDAAGGDVVTAASREGYTTALVTDPARPTTEKKRFLVLGQQMLRVDAEQTHDVTGDIEEELLAVLTKQIPLTDLIIVSDYAKGVITSAIAALVMRLAKQHDIFVMADVKPAHISLFKGATCISPNKKEAYEYLGINEGEHNRLSVAELAGRLQEEFQTGVFLTLSQDGMYVLSGTTAEQVPQRHAIEVADTSGCGDTAAVTVALAKYAGATDKEAATLGNAAGAVNATKIGAQALLPQELHHMVVHDEIFHE